MKQTVQMKHVDQRSSNFYSASIHHNKQNFVLHIHFYLQKPLILKNNSGNSMNFWCWNYITPPYMMYTDLMYVWDCHMIKRNLHSDSLSSIVGKRNAYC